MDFGDEDELPSRKASKSKQGTASKSKSAAADDDEDEEEEEEGIGAWGSSKKDFYNADTIETEADALEEEEEAKKLQKKQLKAMKEADFGIDDFDQTADDTRPEGVDGVVTEVLPQLEIPEDMGPGEKLNPTTGFDAFDVCFAVLFMQTSLTQGPAGRMTGSGQTRSSVHAWTRLSFSRVAPGARPP